MDVVILVFQFSSDTYILQVSEDDLALAIVPGAEFDPKTRSFSAEELKPQPIIKKRAKVRRFEPG